MRNRLIEEARSFLGVRWKHQGRNEFGIDCAGLVIVPALKLGLIQEDVTGYPRKTHGDVFCNHFFEAGMFEINGIRSAKPGDVILTSTGGLPSHCGFFTIKNRRPHILHAYLPSKKVVEHRLDMWTDSITHVLRFPGLED